MSTKKTNYFVNYNFTKGRQSGFGMTGVIMDKEINNFDDLVSLSEEIKKNNKFDGVVIMNYKILPNK